MSNLILRTFALFAVFAFQIGVSAAQSLPPQTSTQSGVTVKVTPKSLTGSAWEFDVVFDTHTQELKDDLMKSAVIVDASGAQTSPIGWKGDPPAGHHRAGVLRFNPVTPPPASVELRIARPGEAAPRSFRWALK